MDKIKAITAQIKQRKDGKMLAALMEECECELDCTPTGNLTLIIKAPCREYCEAIFKLPYGLCIDWAYGKLYGSKCRASLVCMLTIISNGSKKLS